MPRRARLRYDNLDNSQKALVDTIVNYNVIAHNCAAYLRQQDKPLVHRLWEEQRTAFMKDPVTYPATMVEYRDIEGRRRFHEKCQAFIFPPGSQRSLEDHIWMYFAAMAGMYLSMEEASQNREELCGISNVEACKVLGIEDSKDKIDHNNDIGYRYPAELIDQKIHCRDNSSSEIIEYVVVDYLKSMIEEDYFLLEDRQGRRRKVTTEELDEIRVDGDSIELQHEHKYML